MLVKQLFKHWTYQVFAPGALLRDKYNAFKELLRYDSVCLQLISELEEILFGEEMADRSRVAWLISRLSASVGKLAHRMVDMNPSKYMDLPDYFRKVDFYARMRIELEQPDVSPPFLLGLHEAADNPDKAGGKATAIGRIARDTDLPTPPGFVITASAFNYYIEANEFGPAIERRLRQVELSRTEKLALLAEEIQEIILSGNVPKEIAHEIHEAVERLNLKEQELIMRSSALGEDGEISFAGQYASEAHVKPGQVIEAYKRVMAGKYCPRAIAYRIGRGLSDRDTAMAVLVMPMLDAEYAGVTYTRDPDCHGRGGEAMALYCVQGPGEKLVSGAATPEKFFMTRTETPTVMDSCTSPNAELPDKELLTELGRAAMRLEEYFGTPQDVEWVMGLHGEYHIVQSRTLQEESEKSLERPADIPVTPIMTGLERASASIGCGRVHHVRSGMDIANIPYGAVIACQTLHPALSRFIHRIEAVVAETGSRASHFASTAREHGVPVLVGPDALSLEERQVVTVDGYTGSIYAECSETLLALVEENRGAPEEALRPYKDLIPVTVRLGLTDPESEDFSPAGCRSYHDIVRFCHERAVSEMFSLVDKKGRGMGKAKQLKTNIPIVMYILNLGGGLFAVSEEKNLVTPDDISSRPMWAFWFGLSDERVQWDKRLPHMDWEEFDRVSAGIFSFDSKNLASYALIGNDYMHLMLRFGYHFAVVDSMCGSEPAHNYVAFRFKGGGAHYEQRLLRLEYIQGVLKHLGFDITTKSDMLDARIERMDENRTRRVLAKLGYLLASTRLMDMRMESSEQVEEMLERFIADESE